MSDKEAESDLTHVNGIALVQRPDGIVDGRVVDQGQGFSLEMGEVITVVAAADHDGQVPGHAGR